MNNTLPDRDTIYQAVLPLYTINDESDIEKFHLIMYHNLLMYAINHQMDLSDLVNYLTQINEYKKIISDVLDVGLSLPEPNSSDGLSFLIKSGFFRIAIYKLCILDVLQLNISSEIKNCLTGKNWTDEIILTMGVLIAYQYKQELIMQSFIDKGGADHRKMVISDSDGGNGNVSYKDYDNILICVAHCYLNEILEKLGAARRYYDMILMNVACKSGNVVAAQMGYNCRDEFFHPIQHIDKAVRGGHFGIIKFMLNTWFSYWSYSNYKYFQKEMYDKIKVTAEKYKSVRILEFLEQWKTDEKLDF